MKRARLMLILLALILANGSLMGLRGSSKSQDRAWQPPHVLYIGQRICFDEPPDMLSAFVLRTRLGCLPAKWVLHVHGNEASLYAYTCNDEAHRIDLRGLPVVVDKTPSSPPTQFVARHGQ
jgi:hypothetical protein